MSIASDATLRTSGVGFRRASGVVINAAGFLLGQGLWFYVWLLFGVLLTWYGLSNWLAWPGNQVQVSPTGPSQYNAPVPLPAPPVQTGLPPVIQPVPPAPRPPIQPSLIVPDDQLPVPPKPIPERSFATVPHNSTDDPPWPVRLQP